ncbi:MAG TPA: histidine phosphatase family protein [Acetobacteraceae bacterium]|nr:histidine phosphatase family protein [Acetobacteraceae bacterium]
MTLTLHLIRHASYGMLGRGLAGRASGYSLSEQGRAEAEALAASLASCPIDVIVSSPLERARETAEPLARRLGIPVRIDPAFTEIDFGVWTGKSFDALRGDAEWRRWNVFRSMAAIPGGETMHAVQARGLAAVQALSEGEVAIVTHSDVIKALLTHFLGMPLDLFPRIEIAPASRSQVRLFQDNVRVDAINLPLAP